LPQNLFVVGFGVGVSLARRLKVPRQQTQIQIILVALVSEEFSGFIGCLCGFSAVVAEQQCAAKKAVAVPDFWVIRSHLIQLFKYPNPLPDMGLALTEESAPGPLVSLLLCLDSQQPPDALHAERRVPVPRNVLSQPQAVIRRSPGVRQLIQP